MTKLGAKRIHTVRTRGGNEKHRALRLESGNFAWGSEHTTRKTRIIGVVYNASNNELVRTNTIVKSAIVQIDAAPFRQAWEAHYALPVTKKGVKVRYPSAKYPTDVPRPRMLSRRRSTSRPSPLTFNAPLLLARRTPRLILSSSRSSKLDDSTLPSRRAQGSRDAQTATSLRELSSR